MRLSSRHLPRDRVCAIVDQGVFSVTSLVVTVLVAQRLPAVQFGYFALEYAGYWLVLGGLRALVGEPTLIFSGRAAGTRSPFRHEGGPAVTVLLGAGVGAAALVVGLVVGVASLVALAAVFVVVALQDTMRYVLLSLSRAGTALLSDVVGLLVILVAAVAVRPDSVAVWWLVLGAGALAGLAVQVPRVRVRFPAARSFLRETSSIGGRAVVEFVVTSGVGQLVVFLLPVVASVQAVAGLRAAQTLASPLNVLITAIGLVTLGPLSTRVTRGGPAVARAFAGRISLLLIGASVVAAGAVVLVPGSAWTRLFGDSWAFAGHSAPLLCLQQGAAAAGLFATYFLRVSGRAGASVRLRVVVAPVIVVAALVGGAVSGAEGAAVGLFASAVVVAAAYWLVARQVSASPSSGARPVE